MDRLIAANNNTMTITIALLASGLACLCIAFAALQAFRSKIPFYVLDAFAMCIIIASCILALINR